MEFPFHVLLPFFMTEKDVLLERCHHIGFSPTLVRILINYAHHHDHPRSQYCSLPKLVTFAQLAGLEEEVDWFKGILVSSDSSLEFIFRHRARPFPKLNPDLALKLD